MIATNTIERAVTALALLATAGEGVRELYAIAVETKDSKRLEELGELSHLVDRCCERLTELYT